MRVSGGDASDRWGRPRTDALRHKSLRVSGRDASVRWAAGNSNNQLKNVKWKMTNDIVADHGHRSDIDTSAPRWSTADASKLGQAAVYALAHPLLPASPTHSRWPGDRYIR